MKKQLFIVLTVLLLGTFTMNSQNSEKSDKNPKFEISFDAYQFLHPKKTNFSFSFDYLLNESESVGLTATHKFNNHYTLNFNYKHFFSENYAQGLYVETGAGLDTGTLFYPDNNSYRKKEYHSFDLNLRLGYKLVSKNNFIVDIYGGIKKNIGNNVLQYSFPRTPYEFGIKIGKRF